MKILTSLQNKPTLLIALPFVLLLGWIVLYLVLIGTGAITSVPSLDTDLMSPAQLAKYQADQQTSDTWTTVWNYGLLIIVVGGIISVVSGIVGLRKAKQA